MPCTDVLLVYAGKLTFPPPGTYLKAHCNQKLNNIHKVCVLMKPQRPEWTFKEFLCFLVLIDSSSPVVVETKHCRNPEQLGKKEL